MIPRRLLGGAFAFIVAAACERSQPSQKAPAGDSTRITATIPAPAPATPAAPASPDSFLVAFQTSKGRIVVKVVRDWAPKGADHFYALVNEHYYDRVKFFRNIPDFMAQFGINGDPKVDEMWKDRNIADELPRQSNKRGFMSYAMGGPNTRSTQLFINKRDNTRLDAMGFAPIGRVVEGMGVVDRLYTGYGEGAPMGLGPMQDRIHQEGNVYLNRNFPKLDSIVTARVVQGPKH